MIKHLFTQKLFKDAEVKAGTKYTTFKFGIPEQKYAKPGEEAETKWHNATLFAENGSKQLDFYKKNLIKGAVISGEFAMSDREYEGKVYTDCVVRNLNVESYVSDKTSKDLPWAEDSKPEASKKEVFKDFNLDL